ncbi:hypothetical protein ERJ77_26970, partial [Vibrio anguillarum]|nr:hypothetical protein [Vibrio anguillarum]
SIFIGASAMFDIFAGNGVIGSSYKIATTDFELLAKSMQSSNPILLSDNNKKSTHSTMLKLFGNESSNQRNCQFKISRYRYTF